MASLPRDAGETPSSEPSPAAKPFDDLATLRRWIVGLAVALIAWGLALAIGGWMAGSIGYAGVAALRWSALVLGLGIGLLGARAPNAPLGVGWLAVWAWSGVAVVISPFWLG